MRLKLTGLVVAVSGLLAAQSAFAADMPTKMPVKAAPMAPAYSWTGFYVGGTAGAGWGKSSECFAPGGCTDDINLSGFVGGVTAGFNWQWTNWVLGVEGDWSWGKLKGSTPSNIAFNCNSTCDVSVNSFGTLRGRVGYAFDRFLPYLTAGAAFTNTHAIWSTGLVNESAGTVTNTTFAWGGGIEYALVSQWSAKLEYINAGKLPDGYFDSRLTCIAAPGCYTHETRYSVVRAGINYKFGGL